MGVASNVAHNATLISKFIHSVALCDHAFRHLVFGVGYKDVLFLKY